MRSIFSRTDRARDSAASNLTDWSDIVDDHSPAQPPLSVASTNTGSSALPDFPREQPLNHINPFPVLHPSITSPPTPIQVQVAPSSAKQTAHHQSPVEKKPFATCVSRTRRSGRSQKPPRYWCTSCEEGFGEKYDWKRHEETYQERTVMFACYNCENIYFLEKDFVLHHQKSHRCTRCAKDHVDAARKRRRTRTGWGCGFCIHFSHNWAERCHHISQHFDNGKTMDNWMPTKVIYSLLHRPEINSEWQLLLARKQRMNPSFGWNPETTGRVEGYPEANPQPQLQDLLEYYTPQQNTAAAIAQLAFDTGLVKKELLIVKELPPPPPPPPPMEVDQPVQWRDERATSAPYPSVLCTAPEPMGDIPSWDNLSNTMLEDDVLPTNECPLLYDPLNLDFGPNLHAPPF